MSGLPTSSPPAPLLAANGAPPSLLTMSLEAGVSPLFSQSIPHPPGYSWMSASSAPLRPSPRFRLSTGSREPLNGPRGPQSTSLLSLAPPAPRTGRLHRCPCPRLSFFVSPPQPSRAAPARAVHGPRRAPRPRARPRRHLPQVRAAPAPGHQPRRRPPAPPPPARASLSRETPSKKTVRVYPFPTSIKEVFVVFVVVVFNFERSLSSLGEFRPLSRF